MFDVIKKSVNFLSSSIKVLAVLSVVILLTACGGGASSGSACTGSGCATAGVNIQVGAVKGPLTGVNWTLTDGEGNQIASATNVSDFLFELRDGSALAIKETTPTPLLLEIDAAAAIDGSTAQAPVLTNLKTLISAEMLASGAPITVTPLSTLATDVLLEGQGFSALPQGARVGLEANMQQAGNQVLTAFGFNVANGADVFKTLAVYLPLANNELVDADAIQAIIGLRKANEAFALALKQASDDAGVNATPDTILANLAVAFTDRQINTADIAEGVQTFITQADGISDDDIGDVANDVLSGDFSSTGQQPTGSQLALFETLDNADESNTIPVDYSVPSEDLTNDDDGDGENNALDPFPNNPSLQSTSGVEDSNNNGILDPADTVTNALLDLDSDGVADAVDNCTTNDLSLFGTDVNPSQVDTDGDGYGDACDRQSSNPASFDDVDNDGIAAVIDNCPAINNPGQENLDAALASGDVAGVIASTTANSDAVDEQTAQDWIDNASAYAIGGAYVGDTFGDVCEVDGDGDIDGDGRIIGGEGVLADENDVNPDPNTINPAEDTDGDGVRDAVFGGSDNCDNVPNADQNNFDAQDEADALGLSLEELATSGRGVGDACDSDIDNDGVLNIYFVGSSETPTQPVQNTPHPLDADTFTPSLLNVFSDEFSIHTIVSPATNELAVRFGIEVASSTDIPSAGSMNAASNNQLELSRGAGLAQGVQPLALSANGSAGDNTRMWLQNRAPQEDLASLSVEVADCTQAVIQINPCSLAQQALLSNALLDQTSFSNSSGNDNQFGFDFVGQDIALVANDVLLEAGSNERLYRQDQAGTLKAIGQSWIGSQQVVTSVYQDEASCTDALAGISEQAQPDYLSVLSGGACSQLAEENAFGLRVIATQAGDSIANVLGVAADYGLIEFDINYSSVVGSELLTLRTNVNEANGGDVRSEVTTQRGLAAAGILLLKNQSNDNARALTENASTPGQLLLGDLNGFTASDASLLTFANTDAASGNNTSVVGRAYGLRLDKTTTVAELLASTSTYDVTGLFLEASESGFNVSQWLGSSSAVQLQLSACPSNSSELQASLTSRPLINGVAFRETDGLLPVASKSTLEVNFTSECFGLTAGRFDVIDFIPQLGQGTQLQLEGFLGADGVMFRVLRAVAEPVVASGSSVTEDFLLISGYDDSVGPTPNVPEDGEVQTANIWVNVNSQAEICAILGRSNDCTLVNGESLVYQGPDLNTDGSPIANTAILRTATYVDSVNIPVEGGGASGSTENFLLLLGYDDSVGPTPNVPEDGEVELSNIWVNLSNQDEVCAVLGLANGCALSDGDSFVYQGADRNTDGTEISNTSVLQTVTYASAINFPAEDAAANFGFVQLIDANGISKSDIDAAGAENAYGTYTIGQGILFGIPVGQNSL